MTRTTRAVSPVYACTLARLRRDFRRPAAIWTVALCMPNALVPTGSSSWLRTILIGRNPRRTTLRLLVVVAVVVLLRYFVLIPIQVDGPSMLPTYHQGKVDIVNRLAYLWHGPQRGDVVAIRFSGVSRLSGKSLMLMKRVVGLPGETVEFVNGRLLINGRPRDEPYLKYPCTWDFRPEHWQLGDDEFYVVGDNRSMPQEDHFKGAAKLDRIVGKVLL
jgi:signal peptidase I